MAAIGTHAPGGLAIDQLLKLVASGRITAEKERSRSQEAV